VDINNYVKQSRNLTRHMKDLETLYEDVLQESTKLKGFDTEKNVDDQVHPKNSGPENVDGINTPTEVDKKDKTVKGAPKSKKVEKTVKTVNDNINSVMSDKNIFDKLYSTIMEADDELGDSLDIGFGDEGDEGMDDGIEGGDVTITLTQDQVGALKEILSQIEGEGEDEIEDLDGGEDGGFENENPFPEGVEAQHTNDGSQPGHDPSGLTGNNNKVPGHASKTTTGGASADTSGQEDGGKPKSLPDTVSKMTSGSSNKVDGHVKGGNQGLLS